MSSQRLRKNPLQGTGAVPFRQQPTFELQKKKKREKFNENGSSTWPDPNRQVHNISESKPKKKKGKSVKQKNSKKKKKKKNSKSCSKLDERNRASTS